MKNKMFMRSAATVLTGLMCGLSIPAVPSSVFVTAQAATVGQKLTVGNGQNQHKEDNVDGYSYEIWLDTTGGSGSMTLGSGGTFDTEWSAQVSKGNFLARRGRNYDASKKATQYGDIVMNYAADYSASSQGNSRLCVYGWFKDPLVEYYIIEDWVNWRPQANGGAKKATIDGAEYELFQLDHTGPTILGDTRTFKQYFSVRSQKRMSGTITVSDHFKAWADAGWNIGNLTEVALNVEGWESSGKANVSKLTIGTEKEEVTGTTGTTTPTTLAEPDSDGYYFRSNFETGEDSWTGRGAASVETSTKEKSNGSSSLYVSGRTDNWNGAAYTLDPTQFGGGNTYSFGVMAMQNSGEASTLKFTMQYSLDGDDQYDEIASVKAESGEWVQLANSEFKIPAGAQNPLIYVEAPDSKTMDFYIDDAYGAKKGTESKPSQPSGPSSALHLGDVNDDGEIDVYDLIAMRKYVVKMMAGEQFPKQADVNQDGSLGVADLVWLSGFLHGTEKTLPAVVTTKPVTTTTAPVTTTKAVETTAAVLSGNLNKELSQDMPVKVPNGASSNSQCKVEKKTYNCKFTGGQKSCNVVLPPNYDSSKKYPVMYVLHGIGGNEESMKSGMGVQELMTGLIKSGQAEEMIIVLPSQYTSKNGNGGGGFGINQEVCEAYDNFLYDISDSLIPYIEANYPVKTGRENRAITGFSMGGREAIYIGLMRPDLFAYVGGACPAPGITPGSDMFMTHPGCMSESEMKFRDVGPEPRVFMITGGTNDSVVGTFPEQYHNILTRNGVDHVYQSIPGGTHGADSVEPHLYTFMRYAFK